MKKTLLFIAALLCAIFATAQSAFLLASYELGNMGTADYSGNGNHGSGYYLTDTTDRFGNLNGAYYFDGDSSRVDMPAGLLLDTNISISMWFKTSHAGVLLGHQNNPVFTGSSQLVPLIYIGTDSLLYAGFWTATGIINACQDTSTHYNDGIWHHLVLTASPSEQKLYIDNALTGPPTAGMAFTITLLSNQIGSGRTDFGWPAGNNDVFSFEGAIDDVCIYLRELSVLQVDSLFDAPNPLAITEGTSAGVGIKLSPNPANDFINIASATPIYSVAVYDIHGQWVLCQETAYDKIDLGGLAPGVYVLEATNKNGIQRQKFIKN